MNQATAIPSQVVPTPAGTGIGGWAADPPWWIALILVPIIGYAAREAVRWIAHWRRDRANIVVESYPKHLPDAMERGAGPWAMNVINAVARIGITIRNEGPADAQLRSWEARLKGEPLADASHPLANRTMSMTSGAVRLHFLLSSTLAIWGVAAR